MRHVRIVPAVSGVLILCGRVWAQTATPKPSPSPSPSIVIDVDRHVDQMLEEEAKKGTPRFETSIEVYGKSPQIMLERFFGGVDLECTPGGAPPGGGAPTEVEMRAVRPHPSPYVDFAALGMAMAKKLKGKGPERFFLYRVFNNKDRITYLLREGRLTPGSLPGMTYEMIAAFPDTSSAVRGWKRMEHGFPTAEGPDASPPPPWQTTTCRPKR
jgi:hypothetical protein